MEVMSLRPEDQIENVQREKIHIGGVDEENMEDADIPRAWNFWCTPWIIMTPYGSVRWLV